ncbi:MAG: 16S rRNA (uracil(1498)-N(3))-methyltransferase [Pelistega sp.]|nr:16S rRNA (uracil(1498)-N(3))-methyltransferase [Pelistega sp.]
MALPRFFCPIPMSLGQTVDLPPAVANHAGRALRLREGTEIVLFNGMGGQFHAYLRFQQGVAQAELFHFEPRNHTLKGQITLVQALASGDKMDWIIEKATELGVHRLIPIQAERSVLNLEGTRLDKRQQRWQAVAQGASEQCGRNQLLRLESVQSLNQCLQSLSAEKVEQTSATRMASNDLHADTAQATTANTIQSYLCDPDSTTPLREHLLSLEKPQEIRLFIGPEGGWSEKESALMQKHAALSVCFGDRVLRTETAGIALASATAALLDWF